VAWSSRLCSFDTAATMLSSHPSIVVRTGPNGAGKTTAGYTRTDGRHLEEGQAAREMPVLDRNAGLETPPSIVRSYLKRFGNATSDGCQCV
jgi:ABC-type branched-subunit amino acid transport system ATPase component